MKCLGVDAAGPLSESAQKSGGRINHFARERRVDEGCRLSYVMTFALRSRSVAAAGRSLDNRANNAGRLVLPLAHPLVGGSGDRPVVTHPHCDLAPNWRFAFLFRPFRVSLSHIPMVRLEGFEPPTLGSVGTFHSQQLGDLLANIA